jgi:hypothetical protein
MPKYIVLSSHGNGGGRFVEPGEILDLQEQDGRWRTGVGLVKPYVEPPPPAAAAEVPAEDPAAAAEPSASAESDADPAPTPPDESADPTTTADGPRRGSRKS